MADASMLNIPMYANGQVDALALGLALDNTEREAYYVSCVGPKASLDSIRASLMAKKPKTFVRNWHWAPTFTVARETPPTILWQTLPYTAWCHIVIVSKPEHLVLIADPAAMALEEEAERKQLLKVHIRTVLRQFLACLRTMTDVPLLDQWAAAVWREAMLNWRNYLVVSDSASEPEPDGKQEAPIPAIRPLKTRGDCLGAWFIDPLFPWLQLVQRLIQEKKVVFQK